MATYYRRLIIRIKPASSNAPARKLGSSNRVLKRHYNYRKRASLKFSKTAKISAYAGAFLLFIGIVTLGYSSPSDKKSSILNSTQPVIAAEQPSVSKVAATSLAATLAETAELPIASNVSNLSISLHAKEELAQNDDTLIAKPEVVQPETASTREVATYQTVTGDTVPSVAQKFDVTENTVRWANNLSSDALEPGKTLSVPAQDGVVHTVEATDTVDGLANRYRADKDRIVLFNDLEEDGLKPGAKIIIPDGVAPSAAQPALSPTGATAAATGSSNPLAVSASVSAGNRYEFGYCTFYAFNRRAELGRPIGSFWGNANTWAAYAGAAGFTVNNTPAVGAVFQTTAGYYGHVGVVERVNPDGSVAVSEMNYAGWNVKSTRTFSPSEARSYTYIH